jgi:uncharacterized SAM-binding protein YcdF (DUF218 family)
MKRKRVPKAVALLALTFVLLAFSWASYVAVQIEAAGKRHDTRPTDAVVVLGASQEGGQPSAVFEARLDHAADLYEDGVAPVVVVTGGKAEADRYTEATAGVRYLEGQDLPPEALVTVGRGEDTYESLQEVEAMTEQEGWGSVVLVSDRFHMFRALSMAEDVGLEAYGSPTTTSPIRDTPAAQLYYTLREVAAYTTYVLSSTTSLA